MHMRKTAIILCIGLVAVFGGVVYGVQRDRVPAAETDSANNIEVVFSENDTAAATSSLSDSGATAMAVPSGQYRIIDLKIKNAKGETNFKTDVSDTPALQKLGLSGRQSLASDRAMLFVFNDSGYYSFWMKDMKFAIDMIWINEDKKIVYIASNVKPESYPESFKSDRLAKYVLEVKANTVMEKNIKVGDMVLFDL